MGRPGFPVPPVRIPGSEIDLRLTGVVRLHGRAAFASPEFTQLGPHSQAITDHQNREVNPAPAEAIATAKTVATNCLSQSDDQGEGQPCGLAELISLDRLNRGIAIELADELLNVNIVKMNNNANPAKAIDRLTQ
jgi:hypothetical protein